MPTMKAKILYCLQEAAAEGSNEGFVHMSALNKIGFRYGARIHELRADGHEIETKIRKSVSYYRLRRKDDTVSET